MAEYWFSSLWRLQWMESFPGFGKAAVNVRLSESDSWFPSEKFDKWDISRIKIENPGEYYTSRDEQMVFWKGQGRCVLLFCLDNLQEVAVPEGVTTIGGYAFSRNSLKSVILPNSVTEIHTSAFSDCKSLRNVILPDHLETIENSAFFGSGIEELRLPASLKKIDDLAFAKCAYLSSVCVEGNEDNIELSPKTFFDCPSLKTAPRGIKTMLEKKPGILKILKSRFAKSAAY